MDRGGIGDAEQAAHQDLAVAAELLLTIPDGLDEAQHGAAEQAGGTFRALGVAAGPVEVFSRTARDVTCVRLGLGLLHLRPEADERLGIGTLHPSVLRGSP